MRCTLNPPPGPLSWLFPELAVFEPRPGNQHEPHLDLCRQPVPADGLLQQLAPFEQVGVAAGPRGRCFLRILRQRFRTAGPRINLDETIPQLELSVPTPVEPALVWTSAGRWCAPGALPPGALGILPLRPRHGLDDIAAASASLDANARGRIVPVFLTHPEPGVEATTRLAESWWGLLPGDHYSDPLRRSHHELMRELWPDRLLRFRALENHALAGFDLYDEVVRGRYDRVGVEPPRQRERWPLILGVDGIDGAGKSTQLAALRDHLESRGFLVRVHKIYRHGVFHDTVTDLTRQCAGGRNLHLWPLQRRVKLFDSIKYYFRAVEADLSRCDVLVFDRYVQTHLAAGLGRYGHDPYARELLSVYPDPDRVYLLEVPTNVALRRLARRVARTVDENPYMLDRYGAVLGELAAGDDRVLVLDGQQSRDAIHARIRADVDHLLEVRQ